MGESAVDEVIAPIYKAYPDVQTSVLFTKSEIEIHLAAASGRQKRLIRFSKRLPGKWRESLVWRLFRRMGKP
jgi:hypothetical protein